MLTGALFWLLWRRLTKGGQCRTRLGWSGWAMMGRTRPAVEVEEDCLDSG